MLLCSRIRRINKQRTLRREEISSVDAQHQRAALFMLYLLCQTVPPAQCVIIHTGQSCVGEYRRFGAVCGFCGRFRRKAEGRCLLLSPYIFGKFRIIYKGIAVFLKFVDSFVTLHFLGVDRILTMP